MDRSRLAGVNRAERYHEEYRSATRRAWEWSKNA